MWEVLLKRYWQVVLLKESPENTPYSLLLLVSLSFSFFLLIIFQWYLADIKNEFSILTALWAAIALLASYFIYTYALLKIYRKSNRNLQTISTLFASHFILHILAFPILMLTPLLGNADGKQGFILLISVIYLILTMILTTWQFLVTVHIYKNALSVDYLTAMLASFGLLACNILTVSFWQ